MTADEGGDARQDQSKSAQFPEIEATATKAAGELTGAGMQNEAPVAPSAKSEIFPSQGDLNHEAHRNMRWWAFGFVGLVVAAFFALLLAVFCKLFFGTYLVETIKAANESWQWHVLVFLGASFVLLSAIPLSLSLAVMKMISGAGQEDSGSNVKAPSLELVKALADIFKAVATSIKS